MGLWSSITSLGGSVLNTVTGGVSSTYNYVAPRVTTAVSPVVQTVQRVAQPVTTTVQQRVVQPIQTRVIQPVQTRVIQPVQQTVQRQVIQPVQTRVIQPTQAVISSGINLAPKVITLAPQVIQTKITSGLNLTPKVINTLAPVKTSIISAASISNPVTFGMNIAPKVITMGGPALTSLKTNVITGLRSPAPEYQLAVGKPLIGMNVLGGMKSFGSNTISGISNITQDILGLRTGKIKTGYSALQGRADALNVTGQQISTKFAADATEAGWLQNNITKLNTFGAGIQQNATALNKRISNFNALPPVGSQAELDARIAKANSFQADADLIGLQAGQYDAEGNRLNVWNQTMQGKYAENQAIAAAYQNETDSFNATAKQLNVQKEQVSATGIGGIAGWFGRQNQKASGWLKTTIGKPFGLSANDVDYAAGINKQFSEMYATKYPGMQSIGMAYGSGEVSGIIEKPVTAGAWAVAGVAMGGLTRAIPSIAGLGPVAKGIEKISQYGIGKKAIQYGPKIATYGMAGLYGISSGLKVAKEPTAGGKISKAGELTSTELIPMTVGGMVGYKLPEIARSAYDITGKAGLRIIETKPFQTGANALGGSWERAFGRISPGKVAFTPGKGVSRTEPIKMDYRRVLGSTKSDLLSESQINILRSSSTKYPVSNRFSKITDPLSQIFGWRERPTVFDAQGNIAPVKSAGTTRSVRIKSGLESTMDVFHTHPSESPPSPSDFATATKVNAKKFGVVTPSKKIYVVERPVEGWKPGMKERMVELRSELSDVEGWSSVTTPSKDRIFSQLMKEYGLKYEILDPASPPTKSWQASPNQAKSWRDVFRVDRVTWNKMQASKVSGKSRLFDTEARIASDYETGGLSLKQVSQEGRLKLSDAWSGRVPIETQARTQLLRPRKSSGTAAAVEENWPKYLSRQSATDAMAGYNKAIFGTNYRAGQMPVDLAPKTRVKVGQNRVYNYPLRDVRYTRLSEGMVDAYWRGMSNKAYRPKGQVYVKFDTPMQVGKESISGGYFSPLPKTTRVTKPPLTPLSKTWPKSSDVGGISTRGGASPELITLAKEKPTGLPSAKEVAALSKEYNVEKGSSGVYSEATPVYYPTSLDQPVRQGEVMDAYGIPQPGARRRRVVFDEDSLVGVGPLALGGSGAVSVGNLRENYEKATRNERNRFEGYSILPSIGSIGETGLGNINNLGEIPAVRRVETQEYKPQLLPVFSLSPVVAQTPTVTTILSPQFDLTQIPGTEQINLQVPQITQMNLQIPDITQTNIQVPRFTQTTIQQPRLDLYQIEQPFIDIPAFDIPPLVIPPPALIVPPVPMMPLGGGGGGGASGYGARSGFEFTETMPLGDFLSDVFGGAGMDFGGLGSGRFAGFGSGKVKMKKPRKVKAPGRKKKSKSK